MSDGVPIPETVTTALEEYWHPGSIYHGELFDIDAGGSDEFVFGAIKQPGRRRGARGSGVLKIPFSKAKPPAGQVPARP